MEALGPRNLSVSFDVTPAFESTSDEVREHFKLHGYQVHQQEGRNDYVGVGAMPCEPVRTTADTTHSQGSLPNRGNAVFLYPVRPQAVDGCCLMIPEPRHVTGIRQPTNRQPVGFAYPSWEPSGCILPDVKRDGFPPSENLLAAVPHGTMLYCSEVSYWLIVPLVLIDTLTQSESYAQFRPKCGVNEPSYIVSYHGTIELLDYMYRS